MSDDEETFFEAMREAGRHEIVVRKSETSELFLAEDIETNTLAQGRTEDEAKLCLRDAMWLIEKHKRRRAEAERDEWKRRAEMAEKRASRLQNHLDEAQAALRAEPDWLKQMNEAMRCWLIRAEKENGRLSAKLGRLRGKNPPNDEVARLRKVAEAAEKWRGLRENPTLLRYDVLVRQIWEAERELKIALDALKEEEGT